VVRDYTIILMGGLPIDRLKTLIKPGGASKLPLPENCPEDSYASNARCYHNENCDESCLSLGTKPRGGAVAVAVASLGG